MGTYTSKQSKLIRNMTSVFLFKMYCLVKIPLLAWTGARVVKLKSEGCITSVPFKRLNKNPFKSMYFAVQAMAAELSTAGLVMLAKEKHEESIAVLVVGMETIYHKKANQKVYFECQDYVVIQEAMKKAVDEKEGVEIKTTSIGKMKDGTVASTFVVTWSVKVRS